MLSIKMRRVAFGVSIAIIILSCTGISYSILHHLYGEGHVTTLTITTTFENYGQNATVETFHLGEVKRALLPCSVTGAKDLPGEDTVVYLALEENVGYPEASYGGEMIGGERAYEVTVTDAGWNAALETADPVTSTSETKTSETKPIDVIPISSIIGVAAGVIAITAVWVSHRHPWGDAASTLFEHGLTNMTVRDVKIFGEILKLEKFTIPQLMKQTHSSKITVWRAVQKLIEEGLVQPTEQSIPSSNGLGGRGKPSRVYKYVGGAAK